MPEIIGAVAFHSIDSDTNSHNEEPPRSSADVVITRAVINIKSNGEAITEAPNQATNIKPSSASTNTVVKLTRNRRLNKKPVLTTLTRKNYLQNSFQKEQVEIVS